MTTIPPNAYTDHEKKAQEIINWTVSEGTRDFSALHAAIASALREAEAAKDTRIAELESRLESMKQLSRSYTDDLDRCQITIDRLAARLGITDEIQIIREKNFSRIALADRTVMVVEIDGQFEVHDHTRAGISPVSFYPTGQKAAARVLQLLKVGDTSPQTWPETACIGHVTTDEPA